jgi:predicted RNase H-related nuclease YkuK (DUF458 family)
MKIKGTPFVSHVDQESTPEIEIDIKSIYESKSHSFLCDMHRWGFVKRMGYIYDLKPYLTKYVVKQYGHWQEYYAPNKTLLRKSIYGAVDKIFEVN